MLAVAGAATTGVIWYFKKAPAAAGAAGAAKPETDAAAFAATNPNSLSSLLSLLGLLPASQTIATPATAPTTPPPASSVTASMNPPATPAAHISVQQFNQYFRALQTNPNAVPPGPLGPKQQAKVDKLKRERAAQATAKAKKNAHAAARLGSAGQPGEPTPRIESGTGVTGGLKSPVSVTDSYKAAYALNDDVQKPSSTRNYQEG